MAKTYATIACLDASPAMSDRSCGLGRRVKHGRRACERHKLPAPDAELATGLWVPESSSSQCDQAVFVDCATDARLSSYAVLLKIGWFG
jgi:hypothetical protein